MPELPRPARKRRVNWEKWGWLYMRFSGVLLVVLIFGHLFVNLFLGDGVKQIDFAFVAGKLADPFWIVYDLLLLWLALIHGSNGMRTIVNDYAHGRLRIVLLVAARRGDDRPAACSAPSCSRSSTRAPTSPPNLLPSFCSTLCKA